MTAEVATEIDLKTEGQFARPNYLSGHTVGSWLLTTDHKRIGILYLFTILVFFTIASAAAAMMRIELLHPTGGLITSETYNKLFTIHGTLMVWFFLIPSIPTVLGNFVLPMMLGARDVAFPKLNLTSWYIFIAGGALATWSLIHGGVDTGWTFYTPYSTTYANSHVISMAAGVFVAGFSTIITGMNFIVTTHKMRAPGLTWFRLP
ncbi:MAG: cbb3-type cytochrome c oxidase subunit I, partial [Chthoniobacterales bacterium]